MKCLESSATDTLATTATDTLDMAKMIDHRKIDPKSQCFAKGRHQRYPRPQRQSRISMQRPSLLGMMTLPDVVEHTQYVTEDGAHQELTPVLYARSSILNTNTSGSRTANNTINTTISKTSKLNTPGTECVTPNNRMSRRSVVNVGGFNLKINIGEDDPDDVIPPPQPSPFLPLQLSSASMIGDGVFGTQRISSPPDFPMDPDIERSQSHITLDLGCHPSRFGPSMRHSPCTNGRGSGSESESVTEFKPVIELLDPGMSEEVCIGTAHTDTNEAQSELEAAMMEHMFGGIKPQTDDSKSRSQGDSAGSEQQNGHSKEDEGSKEDDQHSAQLNL